MPAGESGSLAVRTNSDTTDSFPLSPSAPHAENVPMPFGDSSLAGDEASVMGGLKSGSFGYGAVSDNLTIERLKLDGLLPGETGDAPLAVVRFIPGTVTSAGLDFGSDSRHLLYILNLSENALPNVELGIGATGDPPTVPLAQAGSRWGRYKSSTREAMPLAGLMPGEVFAVNIPNTGVETAVVRYGSDSAGWETFTISDFALPADTSFETHLFDGGAAPADLPFAVELSLTSGFTNPPFEGRASRLTADLFGGSATIAYVDFYDGAVFIGRDDQAPYESDWFPSTFSRNNLCAIVTDTMGRSVQGTTVIRVRRGSADRYEDVVIGGDPATEADTNYNGIDDRIEFCLGGRIQLGETLDDLLEFQPEQSNTALHLFRRDRLTQFRLQFEELTGNAEFTVLPLTSRWSFVNELDDVPARQDNRYRFPLSQERVLVRARVIFGDASL